MTEFLKTLLIFLLTLTMILLTVCFFVVTVVSDALSLQDLLYEVGVSSPIEMSKKDPVRQELESASSPCQIAFVSGMGQLYMPLSPQEYLDSLDSTQQFLEEALGSCYGYSESTEMNYLLSLLDKGILCVYDYPVPFYALCRWAGANYTGADISVSSMFVCARDGAVDLYIKAAGGTYHQFQTRAGVSFIERVCANSSPNGVISAMTNSRNTADDVPILSGGISLPAYSVASGYSLDDGEVSRRAMSALGINPYLVSVYRDGDTTVYIEDNSRLHLYPDRHLTYSVAGSGGISLSIPTDANDRDALLHIIEGVRGIIFPLWEDLSSAITRLSLSEIIAESDGVYTICFEAYIGGCFISRGDSCSAAARVEDGRLTALSVHPLLLHRVSDVSVLPYAQAQAAARDKAVLRLQYVMDGSGTLTPILADVKEAE